MDAQFPEVAQKVPLYSINDLKNATDDALAPYLTKLPSPYTFKQSHYYTNVKLAVGYSAVVVAAATFYLDWKLGWEATKSYTAAACVLYFILNGFQTLWVWRIEAGKVFVGVREGQQKLTLQSSVEKHVPIYRLKVRYEAPSGKKWEDKEIEGRFTQWFNEAGYLQRAELKKWLADNVEVIGTADPQSKMQNGRRGTEEIVVDAAQVEPPRSLGLDTPSGARSTTSGRRSKRKA